MNLFSTIGFHNGAKIIKASHIPRVALRIIFQMKYSKQAIHFKRQAIVLSHIKCLMTGKTKIRFLTRNFCFRASILVNKGKEI